MPNDEDDTEGPAVDDAEVEPEMLAQIIPFSRTMTRRAREAIRALRYDND